MSRRPNLFIIGAPKSGTTSLYEYLEGHPDVFMSPVKEPGYFSPDMGGATRLPYAYPHDEARYLALFEGATTEQLVGEASARYMSSREAPRLVSAFAPDARVIAIVRNPVDMMYSWHSELVSDGIENIRDFGAAVAADEDRLAGRRVPKAGNARWYVYRPLARFGEQLERWLQVFPREQVHLIVFDDFAADTAVQFRALLEFLGVDPEYQPGSFAARRRSHRSRAPLRALTRTRLAHTMAHRVLPRVLGEPRAKQVVWRFRQSRLNRRPFERPALPDGLRRRLEDELRPDVRRLSQLLGRDLERLWFDKAT